MRTRSYIFNFDFCKDKHRSSIRNAESLLSRAAAGEALLKLVYVVLTISALLALTAALSYLYSSKNGAIHRERYYRQKEEVDVLFAGTSHAYGAYFPMTLYRDYGISAFNLATAGERFAVTYYSLADAFKYKLPKVVVIDCHAFEYGNEKNDAEVPTRCHGVFDGMRLSPLKIAAIKDVLSDKPETWNEYFFPLYYYHNRWQELGRQDFENPLLNNYGKGGRNISGIAGAGVEIPTVIEESDHTPADDYSTRYAEKIVQLCRDKGVDVYFMCIPFPCDEDTQRELNRAYPLAQKYDNCEYINLMRHTDEMDFDYAVDMADLTSHVNLSGGIKVSGYIGSLLLEKYDLKDHRSEDETSVWNKDYAYYTAYLDRLRKENTGYLEYLAMLYAPDYEYAVYTPDIKRANKDGLLSRLVDDDMEIKEMDAANGSYFCSNLGGAFRELTGCGIDELPLDEEYKDELSKDALITIVAYNKVTGELSDIASFDEGGRL